MQSTATRYLRILCSFALGLAPTWAIGCQREDSGNAQNAPLALARLAPAPKLYKPSLSATTVIAGEQVVIDCGAPLAQVASEGQALQAGRAALYPEAPVLGSDGTAVTFVPRLAGHYATHCVQERDGSYAVGPTLTVLPAAAAQLTLHIDDPHANAGETLVAQCLAQDAYGNDVALPSPTAIASELKSFIVAGSPAPHDDAGRLLIDSRLEGAVAVRCMVPAWPHVPPSAAVEVQVRAAPLQSLHARIEQMFFAAHEPVVVGCVGTDAFGNSRVVSDAVVQVQGGDAIINGQSFFADTAGDYQVVCMAPSHSDAQLQAEGEPMLVSDVVAVSITAGPPARFEIRWHDSGPCLSQSTPLPFTWHLYDAYNNPVPFYDVQLVTEPPTPVIRNSSGGFTIQKQGSYTLKIAPAGPGTGHLPAWHKDVKVNSTPPQIVLISPSRADMVQGASGEVMLKGYVKSALGPLVSVSIDGESLPDARGREMAEFSVSQKARWGLNIVHGRARDVCGNEAILTQSYLYSNHFSPKDDREGSQAQVAHAVRARFGQATWDDENPNTLQDVATLMQLALQSSSLEDRLPMRLGAYPKDAGDGSLPQDERSLTKPFAGKPNGIEVFRNGPLQFDHPTLEYLHTDDGGWHVAFALNNLQVPFKVDQYAHWGLVGSGIVFTAPGKLVSQQMRVRAFIRVSMQDGKPKASVDKNSLKVTFAEGAPKLNLELPFDRFFRGMIESTLMRLFHHLPENLTPIIEERVRKEMVKQMDIFLAGLELHHSLPLPPPFETNLDVLSGLDSIDMRGPRGEGFGDFSLFTHIVAPKDGPQPPRHAPFSMRPSMHGSIRRDPLPPLPLTLHGNQSFALAVHDDLLNQMLYALWAGGAFTRQYTANGMGEFDGERGDDGAKKPAPNLLDAANLDIFFMSPPVVMPSENDNEIMLAIGDVWARAELMPKATQGSPASHAPSLKAGFYFSTIIRAHVDIDAEHGHLVLTPNGAPELYLQVNPVVPSVMTGAVHHWLTKTLKSSMPRLMSETLRSFPLPQLAIGRIPGVPKDAVWVPDNGTLERPAHGAEVMVQGTLRDGRSAP